jgi:hypothetical protein
MISRDVAAQSGLVSEAVGTTIKGIGGELDSKEEDSIFPTAKKGRSVGLVQGSA